MVHSACGATSNVSGRTTRSEQPAAPGPAVRRSARAQVTAARTAAGGADSGVRHPGSAARRRGSVDVGGVGDADMFDASEVLDDSEVLGRDARDAPAAAHQTLHHHRVSEEALMMSPTSLQRHESEVLSSLVSKLRNFLVVNMPNNNIEGSIAPLPA